MNILPNGDFVADTSQNYGNNGLYVVPDPASGTPDGLQGPVAAQPQPPQISTLQSIWGAITSEASSATGAIEGGIGKAYDEVKTVTSTVYKDVSSGVGTVYGDVTSPISSALSGVYWYAILGVVVLGAVVYFAGKSGAVKVHAIV